MIDNTLNCLDFTEWKWGFPLNLSSIIITKNLVAATRGNTTLLIDLRHLLSLHIITIPLSLAHSDGTPLKTDKVTKALESRHGIVFVDANRPTIKPTVIYGGILLHESVLQHSESTYATWHSVKVCYPSSRECATTQ